MSAFKKLLVLLVFAVSMGVPHVSLAGGGPGPGIISYKAPISLPAWITWLGERNDIGMRYGLENEEFLRLLEIGGIKAAAATQGVPPNVTTLVLAFKSEIERINYAGANGIDSRFAIGSAVSAAKIFLASQNIDILPLELATAFMTGYTCGFFEGGIC